jgi:hypothetical protein
MAMVNFMIIEVDSILVAYGLGHGDLSRRS